MCLVFQHNATISLEQTKHHQAQESPITKTQKKANCECAWLPHAHFAGQFAFILCGPLCMHVLEAYALQTDSQDD